jgi:S-adenosylmethionine hydrolase
VGFEKVGKRATHFAECEYGELYAIVGSSGYLEIVQREASAAKRLGVVSGAPVDVTGW